MFQNNLSTPPNIVFGHSTKLKHSIHKKPFGDPALPKPTWVVYSALPDLYMDLSRGWDPIDWEG